MLTNTQTAVLIIVGVTLELAFFYFLNRWYMRQARETQVVAGICLGGFLLIAMFGAMFALAFLGGGAVVHPA